MAELSELIEELIDMKIAGEPNYMYSHHDASITARDKWFSRLSELKSGIDTIIHNCEKLHNV